MVLCLTAAAGAQGPEPSQMARAAGLQTLLPSDWMLSTTPDRLCHYETPRTWRSDQESALAWSADGRISIGVISVRIASWTSHKANLTSALRPVRVLVDSADRFWVESVDTDRHIDYVSVFAADVACDAEIEARQDIARLNVSIIHDIALGVSVASR